jgi:methylglutaconyl-CoA hydratase
LKKYRTVSVSEKGAVARVELDRPEVRNAFDDALIQDLHQALEEIAADPKVRAVVLAGRGKAFCAGADLNWMKRMKDYRYEENFEDAMKLSRLLRRLHTMPVPTIAQVHGAAIGGGVGLVAACDIVVAERETLFSLSEVRIGLIPACISPYLLKRMNPGALRAYFLTGRRFQAEKAQEIGLVNEVADMSGLEALVEEISRNIVSCGPRALKMAKELLDRVPAMKEDEYMEYTARMIADIRISPEGQEGLSAFLEKRPPAWES